MEKRNYNYLERIVKGFANHRRIEILTLLNQHPELSVEEIAKILNVNIKTISAHIIKLAIAGLILKKHSGNSIRHKVSDRGKTILKFLRIIELNN
jgi:DNA-binding transcriptional ArsR family regulator